MTNILIGTDATRTRAVGNGGDGAGLHLAGTNTVVMGNTISANRGDRTFLQGGFPFPEVTGTRLSATHIGTAAAVWNA